MYQIMEIAASDNTFPKYDHKMKVFSWNMFVILITL